MQCQLTSCCPASISASKNTMQDLVASGLLPQCSPNGCDEAWGERVFREPQQQAALAHTCLEQEQQRPVFNPKPYIAS
jgi:hypothetical protein